MPRFTHVKQHHRSESHCERDLYEQPFPVKVETIADILDDIEDVLSDVEDSGLPVSLTGIRKSFQVSWEDDEVSYPFAK